MPFTIQQESEQDRKMTFIKDVWESHARRPIVVALLLLLLSAIESDSIKVSIKSDTGDWCIRAKPDGRMVTVEKCYWKQVGNITTTLKAEQTFDVHPAIDEDEEEEDAGSTSQQPVPFLIRLVRKQQSNGAKGSSSSPGVSTSCLSSISSTLTVEKCHLRKSRFRLSPAFPLTLQQAKFCSTGEMEQAYESFSEVRYSLHSSGQSCLEHTIVKRGNGKNGQPNGIQESVTHSLAFSKCAETKRDKGASPPDGKLLMPQLWQFCSQNGNCSLSLLDTKWSSRVKTGIPTTEPTNCEEAASTTIKATTMDGLGQNIEGINDSTSSPNTADYVIINGLPNETFTLTGISSSGSGAGTPSSIFIPISVAILVPIPIIFWLCCSSTELIKIIIVGISYS